MNKNYLRSTRLIKIFIFKPYLLCFPPMVLLLAISLMIYTIIFNAFIDKHSVYLVLKPTVQPTVYDGLTACLKKDLFYK